MSLSKAQGDPTAPQAELDLLADGRELLERWTASPRFRYLYPEGPNLAILLEAYQELDRRRVVGRVRPKRRAQQRAMRRIIRRLAQLDAIARHRRLRWRYPPPRVRPPHVMPSLVRRALGQVDPDARRLVRARLAGQWAPPDPGATLTTEATREARGLEQLRDALINEALAHPEGLAKLHPQFLLFAASAPPRTAASTMGTRSPTFGLSLAQRGRPHPSVTAIAASVASGEWANMPERSSTLGQLRFTSTATTSGGASARASAARR